MCNLYIQWKKWSFVLSAFDFIYGFDILIDRIYMTLETMCCSRNVIKECNMMVKESISVMACTLILPMCQCLFVFFYKPVRFNTANQMGMESSLEIAGFLVLKFRDQTSAV